MREASRPAGGIRSIDRVFGQPGAPPYRLRGQTARPEDSGRPVCRIPGWLEGSRHLGGIGRKLVSMLNTLICKEELEEKHIRYQPKLVIRGSTGGK